MICKTIRAEHYTVEFEEPTLYVDNQARGRSGHMTHAMAEYAPNCFIDFNSNCSAVRMGGHYPYGWVEYRLSEDGGKTYSDIHTLDYSYRSFLDGIHAISVEKAVACDDGSIVAVCLRNNALEQTFCEPWAPPVVIRSADQGKTWSEPIEFTPYAGRPYDALYRDGAIYILLFCNERFLGTSPEHIYRIYRSTDNGITFEEWCEIPFPTTERRGYGSLLFDEQGNLHAYAYNEGAEDYMDHAVSRDNGKTWTVLAPCYLKYGIRNPQTALIDGVCILHGRGGNGSNFVFYTSEDAADWSDGIIFKETEPDTASCFYSNNLKLCDEEGDFLLVQYSDLYGVWGTDSWGQVNVMHMKLRVKKHL